MRLGAMVGLGLCALALGRGEADPPWAGVWRLTAHPPGAAVPLACLRLERTEGQTRAVLLAGPPDAELTLVAAEEATLRLRLRTPFLTYTAVAYLPRGVGKPQRLCGSLEALGRRDLLHLDRLDPAEAPAVGGVTPDETWQQARGLTLGAGREAAFLALVQRSPGQPPGVHAALELVSLGLETGATDADLRARADGAVRLAAGYGREMEVQALTHLAQVLLRAERPPTLALDLARRAQALLTPADPPAAEVRTLRTLALALRRANQAAAAQPVEARAESLDQALDRAEMQSPLPFTVEPLPPAGRVTVAEAFTSTANPTCPAVDLACLALERAVPAGELLVLAYHGPAAADPLACPETVARAGYYGAEEPAVFLNGRPGPTVVGAAGDAADRCALLRERLAEERNHPQDLRLRVTAGRRGGQLEITAEVAEAADTGDHLRLRLVLAEAVVRCPGVNGRRLQRHVVRALPGGPEGWPVKARTARQTVTVRLDDLARGLGAFLDAQARPGRPFLAYERALAWKGLEVVALVQDDRTRAILQATRAAVPDRP